MQKSTPQSSRRKRGEYAEILFKKIAHVRLLQIVLWGVAFSIGRRIREVNTTIKGTTINTIEFITHNSHPPAI